MRQLCFLDNAVFPFDKQGERKMKDIRKIGGDGRPAGYNVRRGNNRYRHNRGQYTDRPPEKQKAVKAFRAVKAGRI